MKYFAVLGDPVAHSRSPQMHRAAYRALGMPHHYEARRVQTAEQLARVMQELRDGTLDGVNVTLPHKSAVLELVDHVDESARCMGAANTIWRAPDGRLEATNTDAPALARELYELAPELDAEVLANATAIVLGSGGAARSAVAALAATLRVRTVVVRARRFSEPAQAAEFLESLREIAPGCELLAEPFAAGLRERETRIVVQASSLGMAGGGDGEVAARAIDWSALPPSAIAFDAVYTPAETPFLHAAGAAGLRSCNGLGMLARQGALAFERWLGVPAPFNAMLAEIL